MDVQITVGPILSVTAQVGKTVAVPAKVESQPATQVAVAAPKPPQPVPSLGKRTELDVDDFTGLFIGRVVDAGTGAVVAQVPSEAIVRLLEKTRQMVGELLNKTA